jgi:hypothetical protein
MAKVRKASGEKGPRKGERGKERGLNPATDTKGGKAVVVVIMTGLLFFFLFLGLLAPDTTKENSRPDGPTIFWRFVFLLVPLGVMYFLLWGEKLLKFVDRKKRRKRS